MGSTRRCRDGEEGHQCGGVDGTAVGRGTLISPTPAGLHRMAAVRAARTRPYGDVLAGWPSDDRDTLADLLHRLNQALDARNRRR